MVGSTFVAFPDSVMAGAVAVNVFAILCTLALCSVALRVAWLGLRWYITKDGERPQVYVFFQTQLGNYAACLLAAMAFNTGAGIMSLPWLISRGITLGPACTTQAVLNQVGTWSSGFFTVTIAVHTFNSLVLKRKQPVIVSRAMMALGWIVSGVMAALPFLLPRPNGDIYGADGLMCGIRDVYTQFRFFLHILPILIAAALSAILYPAIFLILRGTLTFKGGIHLSLNPKKRGSNNPEDCQYNRFLARVARSMIWYPVAYVALLVPYSVLRLLEISGFFVPFQALVFAAVCWFMLGVVNVGLFYNTFRVLGPAFDARSVISTRKDLESWGPSALLDNRYTQPFQRIQRVSGAVTREKATKFHLPRPQASSSNESVYSERGLLSSYRQEGNAASNFSYGATSYGESLSNPKPSMDKAVALAHSHSLQSSIHSDPYPRHVRTPSFEPSPFSSSGRIERHQPPSPADSVRSWNRTPSPTLSAGSRLPQRQLTLLASRSASPRLSPTTSREGSPRPLLLQSGGDDKFFVDPRTPPRAPTAISRLR